MMVKITRRTRSLGYAETSKPTEVWNADRTSSRLEIHAPTEPDKTGLTPKGVVAELGTAPRIYGSAYYAHSFFLGGKRILAIAGYSRFSNAFRDLANEKEWLQFLYAEVED